jgi:hypothetical protein
MLYFGYSLTDFWGNQVVRLISLRIKIGDKKSDYALLSFWISLRQIMNLHTAVLTNCCNFQYNYTLLLTSTYLQNSDVDILHSEFQQQGIQCYSWISEK